MFGKAQDKPELELAATVLNINDGNNEEFLEKCTALQGYMKFVGKVRRNKETMRTEDAVSNAVDECIREDILKDFFQEHREEVIGVGIFEFDEEVHREAILEDGIEIGKDQGIKIGKSQGQIMTLAGLLRKGRLTLEQAAEECALSEEAFLNQCREYHLDLKN